MEYQLVEYRSVEYLPTEYQLACGVSAVECHFVEY